MYLKKEHSSGQIKKGIDSNNARLIMIRFVSGQKFLILFINYSVSSQNVMNWSTVKLFLA